MTQPVCLAAPVLPPTARIGHGVPIRDHAARNVTTFKGQPRQAPIISVLALHLQIHALGLRNQSAQMLRCRAPARQFRRASRAKRLWRVEAGQPNGHGSAPAAGNADRVAINHARNATASLFKGRRCAGGRGCGRAGGQQR